MNEIYTDERIDRMIKIIEEEANNEVKRLQEDARNRAKKQKIKQINTKRDQIDGEFEKKKKNFKIQQRLEKSKKINESRLEIQTKRNDLLMGRKNEVKDTLVERIRNQSQYEKVLHDLILQGLVKLLERNIKIRVLEKDFELAKGLLRGIKNDFTDFIKKELGREITVNLEVDKKRFMKEEEIGGCILVCGKGKIVFKNTLAMRLELAFQDSIPLIRQNLFPSLNKN